MEVRLDMDKLVGAPDGGGGGGGDGWGGALPGFETVSACNISLLIQQREAACRRTNLNVLRLWHAEPSTNLGTCALSAPFLMPSVATAHTANGTRRHSGSPLSA